MAGQLSGLSPAQRAGINPAEEIRKLARAHEEELADQGYPEIDPLRGGAGRLPASDALAVRISRGPA